MDDITVDLGPPIPIMHANVLLAAINISIAEGYFWDSDNYQHAISLRAMLTYRIAKAEKTATFSEPG